MLEVSELTFGFGRRHGRPGASSPTLDRISFNAQPGQISVLLGPNGCGKTTLIRCLQGRLRPQCGDASWQGRTLFDMSCVQIAQTMALVPQEHTPLFPYTVQEIVVMGRTPYLPPWQPPSERDLAAAEEAMALVGISHLSQRPYTEISGGERQLVLLARAVAQGTPLLVMDEPTAHLDFKNQHLVLQVMRGLARRRQITVLVTLHDPNLAFTYADHIILLASGKVIAQGSPEQVMTEQNLSQAYDCPIQVVSLSGPPHLPPAKPIESLPLDQAWLQTRAPQAVTIGPRSTAIERYITVAK